MDVPEDWDREEIEVQEGVRRFSYSEKNVVINVVLVDNELFDTEAIPEELIELDDSAANYMWLSGMIEPVEAVEGEPNGSGSMNTLDAEYIFYRNTIVSFFLVDFLDTEFPAFHG